MSDHATRCCGSPPPSRPRVIRRRIAWGLVSMPTTTSPDPSASGSNEMSLTRVASSRSRSRTNISSTSRRSRPWSANNSSVQGVASPKSVTRIGSPNSTTCSRERSGWTSSRERRATRRAGGRSRLDRPRDRRARRACGAIDHRPPCQIREHRHVRPPSPPPAQWAERSPCKRALSKQGLCQHAPTQRYRLLALLRSGHAYIDTFGFYPGVLIDRAHPALMIVACRPILLTLCDDRCTRGEVNASGRES